MEQQTDPAIGKMTELVQSLTEMMLQGNLPAIDIQDERTVLTDSGGMGIIGTGEAAGPDRAKKAAALAVADLMQQLRR